MIAFFAFGRRVHAWLGFVVRARMSARTISEMKMLQELSIRAGREGEKTLATKNSP